MQFTTQLIIGLVVATILIGILIALYIKIFSKPSTPSSDGCQSGTTNTLGVGCSSCASASCASCTADGDCLNGGTCQKIGSGAKGVCVCPKPYSGLKCETQCLSNSDCPSGSCVNGTCDLNTGPCTTANCQPPNCDLSTCPKCADGWASDKNDPGKKCGICAPGRGPPGDCSKKIVNNITVSLNNCQSNLASKSRLDGLCAATFPGSSSNGDFCSSSFSVDKCAAAFNTPQCLLPNALVDTNFVAETWTPCLPNGGNTQDLFQNTYNGFGYVPQ